MKDNIAVGGVPLMNGSAVLDGYVPEQDATVVARVLTAGATIAGKAVCEALCYSGSSHTSDTGPVLNPYDLRRSSGGSSSGCGALLADRQVDLAIGGDQGGSIRCPSSSSGVVGLKPTYGLVPYTGAFPLEMTLDHLGPMARTVADTALLLDVLAGPDWLDPRQAPPLDRQVSGGFADAIGRGVAGLRIGVLEEGFGHAVSEPDVDESVWAAASSFERLGARVEPVSVPWHRDAGNVSLGIAAEGSAALLRPRRRPRHQLARALHDEHAGSVRGWEAVAAGPPAADGQAAGDRRAVDARDLPRPVLREGPEPRARARARLRRGARPGRPARSADDAAEGPAPAHRARLGDRVDRDRAPDGREHLALQRKRAPAMSVPCALSEGLPVGLMLVGRRGRDDVVLQAAHAFQTEVFALPPPTRSADDA